MKIENIFVIEDDPFFGTVFVERLKKMGDFKIQFFNSCENAMENISQFNPEIIFLDHLLDGTNGVDAIKKIKSVLPKCEVIIVSGQLEYEIMKIAYKNGASNYLQKDTTLFKNVEDFIKKYLISYGPFTNFWQRHFNGMD